MFLLIEEFSISPRPLALISAAYDKYIQHGTIFTDLFCHPTAVKPTEGLKNRMEFH